ncbi:hypothetical protein SUGI_1134780 [Cryptomeria japonica]|nr:hypothetical protein SUGI_1134780 [Cryptomeria japonica]
MDLKPSTHVAEHWREFITNPLSHNPGNESSIANAGSVFKYEVCEHQNINFSQKISNDQRMISIKRELYNEIVIFQNRTFGTETLEELMRLPSAWNSSSKPPKIIVILNHFQRKTLCAQLDSLLHQTIPFHRIWVLAFGSPNENSLKSIVETYNDSRISFVSSSYDYKYYGRFQLALQSEESDFVYVLDDDMIPGRKMLQILGHVAGTKKYRNAVLGSIGRILPFRQKDFTFPSYRKYGSKEAGLYLPDPAYGIIVDKIVRVDFLSSSWFLPTDLLKTLFTESPITFATGEDLHLSYQLQKYRNAGSFVLPTNPEDKETWGDSEHRLAYVSETTVIHKDIVQIRDDQWWRVFSRGYVTQWAAMYPQKIDALFFAHSVSEVVALRPLFEKFQSVQGKKAYIVVSGGSHCPCEEAALALGWPKPVCHERRFKIFDLELDSVSKASHSEVSLVQSVYSSMKGLLTIHNPSLVITVSDIDVNVRDGLKLAVSSNENTSLTHLPRSAVPKVLWITDLKSSVLPNWNRMRISVNIITQNRPSSLQRLLKSISHAYYLGDEIFLTFNMDSKVDEETLKIVNSFKWPHGPKHFRRRIIQGGLIRAVSESWFPTSDDDFGLLLEDDIEVSPYYYLWMKYAVLAYHYDPEVHLPELNSIALYTPRLVEVVKERPKWNATDFFKEIHPNIPYLHQLPCSWGALFFPKHWREFYTYMGTRYTADAKNNSVQIPKSRTNGWQASWKKFLIDMMYLRGYVTLYPNFPNQASFSTNHMEPGAHINASNNALKHKKEDFEVPLLQEDFMTLLPNGKLPSMSKLPVLNLFNRPVSLKGLKSAGAKLHQDVILCNATEVVIVDNDTGLPLRCAKF